MGCLILFLKVWQPKQLWLSPKLRDALLLVVTGEYRYEEIAAMLGIVMVLSRAASEGFGATGAILGAAIAGLADVDAVTISVARLAGGPVSEAAAATAIMVMPVSRS